MKKKIIRLWKRGFKKYQIYQIVVIISSKRNRGPSLENIGYYNPHKTEGRLVIKGQRLAYWLNNGAQLHPTTAKLLAFYGV